MGYLYQKGTSILDDAPFHVFKVRAKEVLDF
jgi:hypothetical protein